MGIKNYINSNSGLIILALSIIISSVILTQNKANYPDLNYTHNNKDHVKLSGEIGGFQIPIAINSTSNDVTYKTELKIADGEKLHVILSNGTLEIIEGEKIIANYFHVSKLLIVEFKRKGATILKHYNSPIKWNNEQ